MHPTGYAPVGETADEAPVTQRVAHHRAVVRPSSRVIEEVSSDGHMLYAWCTLREDDRVFALSRVTSVAPV